MVTRAKYSYAYQKFGKVQTRKNLPKKLRNYFKKNKKQEGGKQQKMTPSKKKDAGLPADGKTKIPPSKNPVIIEMSNLLNSESRKNKQEVKQDGKK